jgi:hypothetical protein
VKTIPITGITGDGKPFVGIYHCCTFMGNWVYAFRKGQRGSDAVRVVPDLDTWDRLERDNPAIGKLRVALVASQVEHVAPTAIAKATGAEGGGE